MIKQRILDTFHVKAYLRCSCTLSTLRTSLALLLIFIFAKTAQAGCEHRRVKFQCEAPGSPCVWGNNRCSLRRLMPKGETDDNPSVLQNFGWRPLNEHKWPEE